MHFPVVYGDPWQMFCLVTLFSDKVYYLAIHHILVMAFDLATIAKYDFGIGAIFCNGAKLHHKLIIYLNNNVF